jgi:hypothetical protein
MNNLNAVLLNAVSATATSTAIDVSGFKNISLQFKCAGLVYGNGVFTVQVSNDGGNTWTDYSGLISNSTSRTVVSSKTFTSNSSDIYFISNGDVFGMIRVVLTFTIDGKYSCFLSAK